MATLYESISESLHSFLNQIVIHTTSFDTDVDVDGGAVWPTTNNEIVGNNNNKDAGYFGYSRNRGKKWHAGIDIGNNEGASVFAFANGKVTRASWQNASKHKVGFGKRIVIEHNLKTKNGKPVKIYSVYGHLKTMNVKAGDTVKAGDVIGTVGRTGNAYNVPNTHLHFEVRVGSYPGNSYNNINPNSLFDFESRAKAFFRCILSDTVCTIPTTDIKNH
jgi:murein DD-endopeptidase MepM/ murein hydrolase activator NlpD